MYIIKSTKKVSSIQIENLDLNFFNYLFYKMNQQEFKLKVKQTQQSLGITQQNFRRKFVYLQQESTQAFYIQRFTPTPSQLLHGLHQYQQNRIRSLACQMMIEAGVFLRLPVTTVISAQTMFHFFYQRVSFLQYDYRQIIMGCIFLAGKSQQTLRRSAHVALVFDQVFKIHQKQRRPVRVLDVNNNEYTYIRNKILEAQKIILIELGFEVYRLLETPHRYMNTIFTLFSRHKRLKDIVKVTWGYLNDSYRTKVCLYYPSQMIATACIYLSMKKLNINMPTVAWWCLLETSFSAIQQICVQILNLYDLNCQYHSVHELLTKVSNNNNIQNVFAVPYYRKITIQNRKKEKLLLQMQKATLNFVERTSNIPINYPNKYYSTTNNQNNLEKNKISPKNQGYLVQKKRKQKSRSRSHSKISDNKRNKKQKKKRKNRSRSRSQSRKKDKKRSKKQKKHKKHSNKREKQESSESQSQNQSEDQKLRKNQQSILPIQRENLNMPVAQKTGLDKNKLLLNITDQVKKALKLKQQQMSEKLNNQHNKAKQVEKQEEQDSDEIQQLKNIKQRIQKKKQAQALLLNKQ